MVHQARFDGSRFSFATALRDPFLDQLQRRVLTILAGIRFEDWIKRLEENDFAIDAPYWPRAMLTTALSLQNSVNARRERKRFGQRIESVRVESPLFILGHWRSGTTHLHNLLALDEQFSFPNLCQTLFPHTFLSNEESTAARMRALTPSRRAQDNVELSMDAPQEDEIALSVATPYSLYLSWVFPRQHDRYDRYLTFDGVPATEIAHWSAAVLEFMRKLTFKSGGRRLLLKSPGHTARIRLLLALFPDARFVHIRRHPYEVFVSSRHTYERLTPLFHMQVPDRSRWDEHIILRYRRLHDAFFAQREAIAKGRLCEVSFDQLERDPVGLIARIYDTLDLPGYDRVEPLLREYGEKHRSYAKNRLPSLPRPLRERLASEWAPYFDRLQYTAN